jgi:PKD repeat protein
LLASGCTSANAPPSAGFAVTCSGLRCEFKDVSADDGTITSRHWSFGDDATSTEVNPVHTYAGPGMYSVQLTATDDHGATGSTGKNVTIDVPPRAAFDFRCSGLTCSFSDVSVDPGGEIVSRRWDFGDGATSILQNDQHPYGGPGDYSVTLTVVDNSGLSDTETRSVSVTAPPVANTPPAAAFTVVCNSLTCTFQDQSSDPDGSIAAWAWNFGDLNDPTGNSTTVQNPQHRYSFTAFTAVTVQLTVTDSGGATAVASRTITVSPPADLLCRNAANTGELVECSVALDRAARVEVELTARDCVARNAFTITAPVVETIFDNGCFVPAVVPAVWSYANGTVFPAGTVITAEMTSGQLQQQIPPSLVLVQTGNPWVIQFDDGVISPPDLDLVVTIRAIP